MQRVHNTQLRRLPACFRVWQDSLVQQPLPQLPVAVPGVQRAWAAVFARGATSHSGALESILFCPRAEAECEALSLPRLFHAVGRLRPRRELPHREGQPSRLGGAISRRQRGSTRRPPSREPRSGSSTTNSCRRRATICGLSRRWRESGWRRSLRITLMWARSLKEGWRRN